MIKILLIFLLISSPVFASGWYSTLQGTASDVEQDIPSDGVILQWSSFYQKWLFAWSYILCGYGWECGKNTNDHFKELDSSNIRRANSLIDFKTELKDNNRVMWAAINKNTDKLDCQRAHIANCNLK